jgi:hypothetical protein
MLKPNIFHSPDEGGSGERNTTIKYVFEGKESDFDISNPDQNEEAKKLIEMGMLHKKKMHGIAETEKKAQQYDVWENQLEAIRNGSDPEDFINAIQLSTNLKLTLEEKKQIEEGEEGTDLFDKVMKRIDKVEDAQKNVYWEGKIENAHNKLIQKYNGKDGLPVYDIAAIEDYCNKEGFMMKDVVKQYEMAYREINSREIIETLAKGKSDRKRQLAADRKMAQTEDGNSPGVLFDEKPIDVKDKSYSQLANEEAQKNIAKGESVYE